MKRAQKFGYITRYEAKVDGGKIYGSWREDPKPVRIMAEAEGYAMVRFPGGMPFAVQGKRLRRIDKFPIPPAPTTD